MKKHQEKGVEGGGRCFLWSDQSKGDSHLTRNDSGRKRVGNGTQNEREMKPAGQNKSGRNITHIYI